jgi:hypothetical protein
MNTLAAIPAVVRIFTGRSESFAQRNPGDGWKRLTNEEEARLFTGINRETKAPSVGVYVSSNAGRIKIGFDLWRIDVNLAQHVVESLRRRWNEDDAPRFSKTALRTVGQKTHFSKSFVTVVTVSERVEFWKSELESVLTNPGSFEHI